MSMLTAAGRFIRTYSTGVVAATISVVFATYMLLTGGGSGNGGVSPVLVRHQPVQSPLKERPEQPITPTRRIVAPPLPVVGDMIITGSITPPEKQPSSTQRQQPRRIAPAGPPPRYVLRFAAPQVALVEGAGRLWRVQPGDILPGAGRVVRIEERSRNRWVVKTFDGRRMREISSR